MVLVEVAKHRFRAGSKIETVQRVMIVGRESAMGIAEAVARAKLDVFLPAAVALKGGHELRQVLRAVVQQIAIIREGQRDQTVPCPPALHTAEHDSAAQRAAEGSMRKRRRLIAVRRLQRLEPSTRLKDGRPRMAGEKSFPRRIA